MKLLKNLLFPFVSSVTQLIFDRVPVIFYKCEFYDEYYTDSLAIKVLGNELHNKISCSVKSRRAEFLAGRYLAFSALDKLKFNNKSVDIGTSREPVWPEGINGSISHSKNYAICAISPKKVISRLGIDVEEIHGDTVNLIGDEILVEQEKDLVKYSPLSSGEISTLIFSAKESLFKALFPEVNRYFDFSVARITKVDYQEMTFSICLLEGLTDYLPADSVFEGRFLIEKGRVITLISN